MSNEDISERLDSQDVINHDISFILAVLSIVLLCFFLFHLYTLSYLADVGELSSEEVQQLSDLMFGMVLFLLTATVSSLRSLFWNIFVWDQSRQKQLYRLWSVLGSIFIVAAAISAIKNGVSMDSVGFIVAVTFLCTVHLSRKLLASGIYWLYQKFDGGEL